MPLPQAINFGKVTVSTTYDASATSIVLTTGHGAKLPTTGREFYLIWWNTNYHDPADDPNVEIVKCTNRSTDTLTVVRGQRGTSASTKNEAGQTYKMVVSFCKEDFDYLNVARMEVPTGTINGSNQSFTTAYSITANDNALMINGHILEEGVDYSVSGTTITMTVAPRTGEKLVMLYYKLA